MQHDIDAVLQRFLRRSRIAQVTLDEPELQPLVGVDREHVVEVLLVPRDEAVDTHDRLAEIEQTLEDRRADKPSDAGDTPPAWRVDEVLADLVVTGTFH